MFLTTEQQHAVQAGVPVRLVDPGTNQTYVLIHEQTYEQVAQIVGVADLSREEKLQLLAHSGVRAGWDDPLMDEYDDYDAHRHKS